MSSTSQPTSAGVSSTNELVDSELLVDELESILRGMIPMIDKQIIEETADFSAVEDLLDELEDVVIEDEVVEVEEEILEADALDAEDVAVLEADIARTELYAEAETGAAVEPVVITESTPKKARATKAPKAPKGPAIVRDLAALPADVFAFSEEPGLDPEVHKAAVISAKPAQIKIAEKFENLFVSIANKRTPNVYTARAFEFLVTKETITTGDLVGHFKGLGYTEGTARSQAGQIMSLFSTVGIAKRAGSTLVLDQNSVIAAKLIELPGVSA